MPAERAAAPTAPAAPAAPHPSPALQRQAAPATAAGLRAAVVPPWTQVRIEAGGHSVVVPRAQAGTLPSLIARTLATAATPGGSEPASLRLELAQGDDTLGVLELVGERWRWRGAHEAARMTGADAALTAALQEEAQRLLGR